MCDVAQGRGAGFDEVLSRGTGDAVVCTVNLETEELYTVVNLWLKRSAKGISALGERRVILEQARFRDCCTTCTTSA